MLTVGLKLRRVGLKTFVCDRRLSMDLRVIGGAKRRRSSNGYARR
jgi:hypothetical protein